MGSQPVTDHMRSGTTVWHFAEQLVPTQTGRTTGQEHIMPSDTPKPLDFLDHERRRMAERRYSRMLLLINGIPVGILLIAIAAIYLLAGSAGTIANLILLIPTCVFIVVLAINYALFRILNRRGVWWAQPSPLLAIRLRDRRRFVKALRRDEPIPDDIDSNVVQACLRWFSRMRAYMLIMPCIAVLLLAFNAAVREMQRHDTFFLVYSGALAVFVLVMTIRRNRPITRNSRNRLALADPGQHQGTAL